MKFLVLFTISMLSVSVKADDCMVESEAFFKIIAAKWSVNRGIANEPAAFSDEKWLYIWAASKSAYAEKNIQDSTAKAMAKLVAQNDFSNNPQVEVNIFEDYWYLRCKLNSEGSRFYPLNTIAKDKLIGCWENASSRAGFQACLKPLIKAS
ncbi:hypothetical protein [Alteromonas gilva]|uniref:DUF3757 domain-containing protein n=1 Tax=Alteromonas gilva TaxID=2987522 RepID=A0ABT5L684_9ALTE|nr:hypothetical protein [Alteromonas gilva]MDC8831352.1 hypothetical protein [Alteromonas gilva]